MKTVSFAYAQKHLYKLMDEVHETNLPIMIKHGDKKVVMLSEKKYEKMQKLLNKSIDTT